MLARAWRIFASIAETRRENAKTYKTAQKHDLTHFLRPTSQVAERKLGCHWLCMFVNIVLHQTP
jgi:hypothetical protein